ncbi:MAG: FG-GAP-like repeat-containing protein [Rhodothermales bacterium]|nr:FG-GAP-like repeat-containing protein [Rhodothermales bacterium]
MFHRQTWLFAAALLVATPALAQQSPAPDFIPDYLFEGSQLTAWQPLGTADWSAQNGTITGTARGSAGGLLVFDRSYEDVSVFSRFQCTGACDAGVLLRLEKTDGGMSGILISLREDEVAPFRVTLDVNGAILTRELAREPREDDGVRNAPSPLTRDAWNTIEIFVRANEIQNHLNGVRRSIAGGTAVPQTPESAAIGIFAPRETMPQAYGPIALYVGSGSVRFEDVAVKDWMHYTVAPEHVSDRFSRQHVAEFHYSWGVDAGDIDGDGVKDLVAGPYYYLGPDFRRRREYFPSRTFNPGVEYTPNMLAFAKDWTGDGWTDLIVSEMRQLAMFINPQGESRRWDRVLVVPDVCSEITIQADIDSDGEDEMVYVDRESRVSYGEPDAANPTGPWRLTKVSATLFEFNGCSIHGVGAGDVNGDGRTDVLQATGWWEQPATNPGSGNWKHHEVLFGESASFIGGGGAISVYDFNGDGLNDVITSLSAHGWGLAWYEQQRNAAGAISFEKHHIMGDFSTKNVGDVTFSELHAGAILADINRDGIMDFVTGKRHWAHLDTLVDPDPDGEAVTYWYETVRRPDAPGGVVFVPHLVHNKSGVGSEAKAKDINGDGAIDILTSGTRGTFILWGKP